VTHVARIELRNWMRFRSAAIDLGPMAYAIEAELDGDPARSNWLGKSSLAEAIPFALYGWHRFQEGERAPGFEEQWISDGANEGGATLTFDDGSMIERIRRVGSSTQLRFTRKGEPTSAGDRAQEAIESFLGLGRDDFFSTAFVRQKRCAQLVSSDPSGRMKLISDWLDFRKLEDAGKLLGRRVGDLVQERDRLSAKVADIGARVRSLEVEEHFERKLADISSEEVDALVAELREGSLRVEVAHRARVAWDAGEQARKRAEDARAHLAEEERRLAELPQPGTAPHPAEPMRRKTLALAAHETARKVARGDFDGACPVRAGFVCPAVAEINAGRSGALLALSNAKAELDAADHAEREALNEGERVSRALRAREIQEERVRTLRKTLPQEGPEDDRGSIRGEPPAAVTMADVERARLALQGGVAKAALYRRSASELERLRAELERAKVSLSEVERSLVHSRAARLVVGRGGAQRLIAERAVELIAAGANRRLANRGIGLRVGLSWRREGAELAASCEACGAAYPPRNQRGKVCVRCGEARGKSVQDRLDVELSDRSGAAEDLAGLALQRSACAFLRRRRGAPWSALVLDEPFGALDERHREEVTRSLAAMREEDGVAQLFVIAHSPGILESLPGRILIRGSSEGESTVEVIE